MQCLWSIWRRWCRGSVPNTVLVLNDVDMFCIRFVCALFWMEIPGYGGAWVGCWNKQRHQAHLTRNITLDPPFKDFAQAGQVSTIPYGPYQSCDTECPLFKSGIQPKACYMTFLLGQTCCEQHDMNANGRHPKKKHQLKIINLLGVLFPPRLFPQH